MPKRYRKKPVEIEAIQYTGANADEIIEWSGGKVTRRISSMDLMIHTLEGVMVAKPTTYIIKGVLGEFYPCRDEIFESIYDEI